MDWIACLIKLVAWWLISKQNRWGFAVSILGNMCLGVAAYQSGLSGVIVYCVVLSFVQTRGWYKWSLR